MRKTFLTAVLCLPLCFSAYGQNLDTLFANSIVVSPGVEAAIPISLKNGSFPIGGMTFEIQSSDSVSLTFVAFVIGSDFSNFEYFNARISVGTLRVTAVADMPGFSRIPPLPVGNHIVGNLIVNIGTGMPADSQIAIRFIPSDGRPCAITDSTGMRVVYPATIHGNVRMLGPNSVEDDPLAARFELSGNYPNPFNLQTKIRFSLAEQGVAEIEIYDITGRFIYRVFSGFLPAGDHVINWDGRGEDDAPLPSGVYLYRLTCGEFAQTRKMCLIK